MAIGTLARRHLPLVLAVALVAGGAALVGTARAAAPSMAEDMVAIPGGTYTLGSDRGARDARPAHTVTLAPFAIDRTEVTAAAFAAFLNGLDVRVLADAPAGAVRRDQLAGPDARLLFEGREGEQQRPLIALDDEHSLIGLKGGRFVAAEGFANHPVPEVTWDGAVAFCAARGARLPTEAEWEAAARGREGRTYPWGEARPDATRAVIGRRSGETEPVGSRPAGATPEGLLDMAGNLQEWTSTLYRPYPYDPADGRETPGVAGERVTRGGDHVYDDGPATLTGFHRTGFSRAPDRGHRQIGFRCAR